MNRRQFVGSALAVTALGLGGVTGFQAYQQSLLEYSPPLNTRFLNSDDQLVLQVLIPVISQGIPNRPELTVTIENIDQAIIRLPLKTQDELRELFSILGNGLGRMVLAGVWLNWQSADSEEINSFLNSWRSHSLNLLQQAYIGLQKLIIGSIYSESSHWTAINYPGPIQLHGGS